MNTKLIQNLFTFYISAEKLKTIIRHSWTSDPNRTESTAEHTWMLCLIAITLFEHITLKIDQLKTLKMLIIHDLAEIVIGDIPAFDTKNRIDKYEREHAAMKKLLEPLPDSTKHEFMALWEECEKRETNEAKVAQAIDKLEAPLQHNIFPIEKWDQGDFDIHGFYKYDTVAIEPLLTQLRETLEEMSYEKISQANQLHRLPQHIQKRYNERINKNNEIEK